MLLDFVHFVLLVLGIGTAIVLVIGGIVFAWDEAEARWRQAPAEDANET